MSNAVAPKRCEHWCWKKASSAKFRRRMWQVIAAMDSSGCMSKERVETGGPICRSKKPLSPHPTFRKQESGEAFGALHSLSECRSRGRLLHCRLQSAGRLSSHPYPLHLQVLREVVEQVPVNVAGHSDRQMPQHGLDLLRRPSLLDEERRSGGSMKCSNSARSGW